MTTKPDISRLTEGDSIPAVRLSDQDGDEVEIYRDSIVGDPVVLLLCPDGDEAGAHAEMRRFAELAEGFKREHAHVFVVTTLTVDDNRALAEKLGLRFRILSDRNGELLAAFGLDRGEMGSNRHNLCALLRPNLRIAKILTGKSQADAALAGCGALTSQDGAPVIEAQAPVLIVDNVFPREFCDFLIGLWERGDKQDNQVTSTSGDSGNARIKRRTDHLIYDDDVCTKIHGYFVRRLIPEMNKGFRFGVTRAEVFRIGCYDADSGGYFRRHRDRGAPHLDYRSFALSLNLNTGDYEGGHLRFPEFGPQLYQPPRGGGVVFSCSLLHEALPVTKGRRFALFTFFSGQTLK